MPALLDDPRPEVRAQAAEWAAAHPAEPLDRCAPSTMLERPGPLRALHGDGLADPAARRRRRAARAAIADPARRRGRRARGRGADRRLRRLAGPAQARLDDPDPGVRAWAARVLGELGGDEHAAAVAERLDDPEPDVRAAAAVALGRLGHWPSAHRGRRAAARPGLARPPRRRAGAARARPGRRAAAAARAARRGRVRARHGAADARPARGGRCRGEHRRCRRHRPGHGGLADPRLLRRGQRRARPRCCISAAIEMRAHRLDVWRENRWRVLSSEVDADDLASWRRPTTRRARSPRACSRCSRSATRTSRSCSINDGSTDDTLDVLRARLRPRAGPRRARTRARLDDGADRGVYRSRAHAGLVVVDKVNGGKADALNVGLDLASGELVCAIDSDTLVEARRAAAA